MKAGEGGGESRGMWWNMRCPLFKCTTLESEVQLLGRSGAKRKDRRSPRSSMALSCKEILSISDIHQSLPCLSFFLLLNLFNLLQTFLYLWFHLGSSFSVWPPLMLVSCSLLVSVVTPAPALPSPPHTFFFSPPLSNNSFIYVKFVLGLSRYRQKTFWIPNRKIKDQTQTGAPRALKWTNLQGGWGWGGTEWTSSVVLLT